MKPQYQAWVLHVTGATIPDVSRAGRTLAEQPDDSIDPGAFGLEPGLAAIEGPLLPDQEHAVSAEADRLAATILRMDKVLLGLESGANQEALAIAFDNALERVSFERLLLGLCHNRDIDEVVDDAETTEQPALAWDEAGIVEVTAAVTALCTNVARSRGVIGATETGDDRKIAEMIKAYWGDRPTAEVSQLIPDMIEHFGSVFVAASDGGLAGLLNLPERSAEPSVKSGMVNAIVPESPGGISDEAIAAAADRWRWARAQIQAQLATLKQAVDREMEEDRRAGFEFVGGSWAPVTAIFDATFDHSLDGAIMAIAGKAGAEKTRAIADVRTEIESRLALWGPDQRLSLLDATPLLPGEINFRGILQDSLLAMRDLMVPGVAHSPG